MLRRRGRGGRSGESCGVCGAGSLGAGLRRGAAERSRGAGPAFPPCCWLRGTAVKSMHLFPGCGARNGVRPICSLRGTARRPPARRGLLPAAAAPRGGRAAGGKSRMGPATPPADSHGGRTSGGRGSVRAPGAARASEPLSAQQATGPHTELRVAGRAPRPRSLPQLQRIQEHVQPPGKGAEKEASGASRSALASASGATGIPRLLRWTGTVPADVSRRRVTGHGQSTASTQPLRITARREFAVRGTVHLRGTAVASSAQVCADRSLRPPAASQAGHVRARPSDVRRGLPASCS